MVAPGPEPHHAGAPAPASSLLVPERSEALEVVQFTANLKRRRLHLWSPAQLQA